MCRPDGAVSSNTSSRTSDGGSSSSPPSTARLRRKQVTATNTVATQSEDPTSIAKMTSQQQQHKAPFTIGGLKVLELHGVLGSLSFCLSFFAVCATDSTWMVILAMILSSVVAIHSQSLLEQAPMQTTICESPMRTVAPHREAFQRTSIILLYVNARILALLLSIREAPTVSDRIGGLVVVSCACSRMFFPWKALDLQNGNTFCFVIPMMISVLGDYLMTATAVLLNLINTESSTDKVFGMDPRWDLWILQFVQLAGLVIAFLFTMAFRKLLSIKKLYWIATVAVNLLAVIALSRVGYFFVSLITSAR